jgi:hypothetical protein
MLFVLALYVISPVSPAHAGPFGGDPCQPASAPAPEAYGSGTDGLIQPPDYPSAQLRTTPDSKLTYYDRYGTAGQNWYAVDMGCSDAVALMGNSVANTIFTLVRTLDRATITIYQSAASDSLIGWLKGTVDNVIQTMGKTFNARYWSWVVILGAMWLAWWGLIRRRATKVVEGTVWMLAAMVGLVWLIARPADFTTLGTKVSSATSAAFNAALPQSNPSGAVCVPAPNGTNPAASPTVDSTTRNANSLWVALVCKPWLMGEFGTDDPNSAIVKNNADKLLNAQAVDLGETYGTSKLNLSQKSGEYKSVSSDIQNNYPGTYALFQGKQWTSRLAVAFGGLFAALVAGMLIMVISLALIVVKISFLLLLVAGPVFLGIGIHPGIGRVIAVRWLELLLSMLLKQAALIGVLALLLWAYGLILGQGLPWGLQILLIALVTFAAFIYRKPFQHLFSAVGYSAVGSREKSEEHLSKSITEVRKNTGAIATVPGTAGYRIARWAKRDPLQGGDGLSAADASGSGVNDPAGAAVGRSRAATVQGGSVSGTGGGGRSRDGAPPLNLPTKAAVAGSGAAGTGIARGGSGGGSSSGGGSRGGTGAARPTSWAGAGGRAGAGAGGGGVSSGGGSGRGGSGGGSGSGRGSGGSGGSSGAGSGRGWFGGGGASGDGGASAGGRGRMRERLTGGSGGSGGSSSGSGKRPSGGGSNVPKPRSGGGASQGSSEGKTAPPLWGQSPRDDGPPIPFWLRPVDREDG